MDGDPKRRRCNNTSQRPQIYVHLEFGVSWSSRHVPNVHQAGYRSKGLRDRGAAFPRQVPPTNTNYLAAPPTNHFPSQAQQHQEQTAREFEQRRLQRHHTSQVVVQPPRHSQRELGARPSPIPEEEERRSSRDSRSSHERGHSAPPPISDNAWDITSLDGSFVPFSADPATAAAAVVESESRQSSMVWKDLPPTPHNFRLGEDEMPWTWSWPLEYGYEDVAEGSSRRRESSIPHVQRTNSTTTSDRQSMQSMQTMETPLLRTRSGPASPVAVGIEMPQYQDIDPNRNRELEALSAALVTVDNGFENQWWQQGAKESIAAAAHPSLIRSSSARTASEVQHLAHQRGPSVESLGWAVARQPETTRPERGNSWGSISQVISPVSPSPLDTPGPRFTRLETPLDTPGPRFTRLERSLSTRSEELFLSGGRYA